MALVRNELQLNEEKDPQQEIALLRADVRRLKEQIAALTAAAESQVQVQVQVQSPPRLVPGT